MVSITKTSFVNHTLTVLDTTYGLVTVSIPYYECNILIKDHDVYYGDGTNMDNIAKAGSVLTFKNGDLKDIFFKNYTAGNTATVVVSATVPTDYVQKVLKL